MNTKKNPKKTLGCEQRIITEHIETQKDPKIDCGVRTARGRVQKMIMEFLEEYFQPELFRLEQIFCLHKTT